MFPSHLYLCLGYSFSTAWRALRSCSSSQIPFTKSSPPENVLRAHPPPFLLLLTGHRKCKATRPLTARHCDANSNTRSSSGPRGLQRWQPSFPLHPQCPGKRLANKGCSRDSRKRRPTHTPSLSHYPKKYKQPVDGTLTPMVGDWGSASEQLGWNLAVLTTEGPSQASDFISLSLNVFISHQEQQSVVV